MGGTGWPTASSTRPLLPLSPIFEHRARAEASPYAHGRHLHSIGSTNSRLVLFYSSYIDLLPLHYCNITLALIVGPAGRRKETTSGRARDDAVTAGD